MADEAKQDDSKPPYTTGADLLPQTHDPDARPTAGLSQSPGLRAIEGSTVPGLAGGGTVSHVVGPQQNPVDPIAAGLDTKFDPMTRAENRAVTLTGEIAAGPRPSTYAQTGQAVQQAAPATGETIAATPEPETKPTRPDMALKPASEAIKQAAPVKPEDGVAKVDKSAA